MGEAMSAERTDAWLVARLQEGDLEALGELYERHQALVYRTALAITRDEKTADDVLQDVFLRVYSYAGRIDPALPLEPWLYRVTVNQTYSLIARARRLFQMLQVVFDRWVVAVPPQGAVEAAAEQREARRELQRAIAALPNDHQVVVVLHYLEELSLEEIAQVLKVPEGTVKSRLHYARRKLRQVLESQERMVVPEVAYDFT
jgi:RNA polymerase sigma-70 factor, ECF subfamily